MRICKRCNGSSSLFRPKEGLPIKESFKKCTDCEGSGIKGVKSKLLLCLKTNRPPKT